MLERNHCFYTLRETDLSFKKVYNRFFEIESCILYVVDSMDRFLGVITSGKFMRGGVFLNRRCCRIGLKEESRVFEEARGLFEKYGITTGIPVVDDSGRICYEIRKRREEKDTEFLEDFYEKFRKYERSPYLAQEIANLRKILREQPVTVVGTEEQFRKTCGGVFNGTDSVTFIRIPEDPYKFMENHTGLLIDVSSGEYSGRRDLYALGNNGYGWQAFLKKVLSMIEMECFSRFVRVTEGPDAVLQDYLEKYSAGTVTVSSWGILTGPMRESLKGSSLEIREERGICRKESFQYDYRGNGTAILEPTGGELLLLEQADVILQYAVLNEELRDSAPILNFVFDTEVKIPHRKEEEVVREKLFCLKDSQARLPYYEERPEQAAYRKELADSLRLSVTRRFENDWLVFRSYRSRLVNVENGMRRTWGQPEEYAGTIYFFGMCTMYGALVEDAYTIPSLVQKKLNAFGRKYRAVNLGSGIPSNMRNIREVLHVGKNDRVVVLFPFITEGIKRQVPVTEIGAEFHRIWEQEFYGKECFMDSIQHCGDYGNQVYAEIIYRELEKSLKDTKEKNLRKHTVYDVFRKNHRDLNNLYALDRYLAELRNEKKKIPEDAENVGAVVMNCNPFTLGHRYLIEYALGQADYLFVFVVEEDKSFFSFEDRYEMVKRGTCDLERVSVVPSGKLMISSETFPTYFRKEEAQYREDICPEEDLRIFAQYIAPELDIRCRFVGEEPKDFVTRQYNRTMKRVLPAVSGIRVIEVPRKSLQGEAISATEVRKLYCRGDFGCMGKWVPKTTLEYLGEKRKGENEEKYVVWGAGDYTRLLLENFSGLEDSVEVFLDRDQVKHRLGSVPVIRPEAWDWDPDTFLVICGKNSFHEIYKELVWKYQWKKERILSAHEWVCKLLRKGKIKLSPRMVRLETCTLCQLDCPYCYMRTGNSGTMGKGYLRYEAFQTFVDRNPRIRKIEISNNGEVFLNPDLGKILSLAAERKIEIVIGNGTNFNTVSEDMLELLVQTRVSYINVSIDGASQEIYSMYRRGGDFEKVISNIRKLNACKEKYGSPYPRLQWQYILMPHNECDVEKAAAMAKELNMDIWYKYECVKGRFEPKDREKLERITGLNCFSLEEYNRRNKKTYGSDMCYQTVFQPQIHFDGRLLGCCMLWNEDLGINVFETGLEEALNSERYLQMVGLLLGMEPADNVRKDIPCLHCGQCGRNIRNRNFMYL